LQTFTFSSTLAEGVTGGDWELTILSSSFSSGLGAAVVEVLLLVLELVVVEVEVLLCPFTKVVAKPTVLTVVIWVVVTVTMVVVVTTVVVVWWWPVVFVP
jgi:hypothetical protein